MRLPPRLRTYTIAAALGVTACAAGAPDPGPASPSLPGPLASASAPLAAEAPPLARLPTDTRPTRYVISLRVDPAKDRFSGVADVFVTLDRRRDVLWLHGRDLSVRRATIQAEGQPPIEARWEQVSPSGVAAVRPASPVGPGKVVLHVEYDAPYAHNDEGLYVVSRGGDRYAFTQFEATDARRAFPCFDEPAFKTPYELTVSVPQGLAAVSNTREVLRQPEAGLVVDAGVAYDQGRWDRVVFAPTPPLPSYLLALAVGPLDVVAAPDLPPTAVRRRPLPLRGVAARGRGRELSYALSHAGALVTALEGWFGTEYPYDKLDLLAVPEKSGAMENAGAIAFAEGLLLLDPQLSSVEARFNFSVTVGHEISHQWFGDLVTMPWWNDLWLNEAFATWMETRVVSTVRPELRPEIRALDSTHRAMDADGLVSARKIRQEIADDNDIESAFDAITYDKGGAVLSMFERWLGAASFQKGVRGYLAAHRFGTAGADDLLTALSAAAGRDVAGPLRTFLDQPGLPFVEARVACDGRPRLLLHQSRFLPLGSSGASGDAATWQIPVCARYGTGKEVREACTLLAAREGTLPLDACPDWVMPNADAAGYYRWSLASADRKRLAQGLPSLGDRERMSFARSVGASFLRGGEPIADVLDALAPFASDSSAAVAMVPMDLLAALDRWLEGDPAHARFQAWASALYAPVLRAVGWGPRPGEPEDFGRAGRRQAVVEFLALTAQDRDVRREATARAKAYLGLTRAAGRRPVIPEPELLGTLFQVAAEDGGPEVFEALRKALATEGRELERRRLLEGLGSATDAKLAAEARALELDPRVRSNEVGRILAAQLKRPATRDAAWAFFAQHLDELIARMPAPNAYHLISNGIAYCDAAHRDELQRLFAPRVASIEGGPRSLAGVLEEMSLCIARRAAHEPGARAYFSKKKTR